MPTSQTDASLSRLLTLVEQWQHRDAFSDDALDGFNTDALRAAAQQQAEALRHELRSGATERWDGVTLCAAADFLDPSRGAGLDAKRAALHPDTGQCDHKFIDSTNCLKCGWIPPDMARATEQG